MPVDSKHPQYGTHLPEWQTMRDAARGEIAVKDATTLYLPMPSGFRLQDDGGVAMYQAYQTRAQFPEILKPTLRGMVGVIHRTEAQIDGLEETGLMGIWERATRDGLSLEAFHRRVTAEILLMGRYGILVDAASEGSDLPFFGGYTAEALINWSEDRDLFVLDESGKERNGFEWRDVRRFRVLRLENGRYVQEVYENSLETGRMIEPTGRGARPLDAIPFVVVGPRDLAVAPDDPPLIGVARASLAMYRLDADYRHQLFNSGQETLVVINGQPPLGTGAGVVIKLEGDLPNMDAKYIGPSGTGIAAHRTAIQDERDAAVQAGAQLFDAVKRSAESGEALRLRYAAQTATLISVAQASAAAIETALRHAARMVGANPNLIVVKPNLDFVDTALTPAEAMDLVRIWQAGALSKQTLYENLQKGELASPERSFEDEEGLIEDEGPALSDVPPVPFRPAAE